MAEKDVRPWDANRITRDYIDSILIEQRLIDSVVPDLTTTLFGETFASPIVMPAFSHLGKFYQERPNGMIDYSVAAKERNMLNFVGMMENHEFHEIMKTGAKTVRVVKPYADRDKVFSQLLDAKEHGALAVGVDIDHIFGSDGKYDVVLGEEMTAVTSQDLRSFVEATDLPFLVKGVLSVQDAVKSVECGAKAILVSHHSGRLPYAMPPLAILPEIVKEVGGKVTIFVDCSINTGADAYKALALGADAVAVGRALIPSLVKDGCQGAKNYLKKMDQELAYIMGFTGCKSVKDMDPSVLHIL